MSESKTLRPVGRIDFLDTTGQTGESCYYYTDEEFLKTVKEENYDGVPMVVKVFRDENGQTIPLDFVNNFDPLPQGFKILDYKEGEDMNDFRRLERLAKQYKALYPEGTRIELVMMGSDPRPIDPGTRGTVDHVDDLGTIHCSFDNGRRLGIIPEEDSFRVLTQDEVLDERSEKLQKQFIDKVNNEVIPCVEWVGMRNAYKKNIMDVPKDLLKDLHEKFLEVYGTDYLDNDYGFVTVPGVVQGADGKPYVALLDLDVTSSGEHWGTFFFTPDGTIDDQNVSENMMAMRKQIGVYKYWYTPVLERDHHVDFDNCPDEITDMLNYATEQSNEVKLE